PYAASPHLAEPPSPPLLPAPATPSPVLLAPASCSRVLEQFPVGGGGYVVASRLLGPRAGVVSGSALIVDYVLTISISIAAGGDAVFSVIPNGEHWAHLHVAGFPLKLQVELAACALLVVLNLRGVKES